VDDPLIWWRAVHFAATTMLAGVVFFLAFVAEPAFSQAGKEARLPARVRSRLGAMAWVSLLVVVVSGAAWLILLAQQISDGTLNAVLQDGIVWIVLTKTGFGTDWTVRFALAVLVAAALPIGSAPSQPLRRAVAVCAAAGLVGALGFAGHAAAGSDTAGLVHLAADVVHLVAAAAWVGALVPLALLLHAAARSPDQGAMAIARRATLQFSVLGVTSVGALLASGLVNTWFLAGSVSALVDTEYGHLLLIKIGLFLVMVATAAVNRQVLTPRLIQDVDAMAGREALRRLRRNSLIEGAIGAIVLIIVGVLGTLPPGLHEEGLHDDSMHHEGMHHEGHH
jgi:putative copper resistance protein D